MMSLFSLVVGPLSRHEGRTTVDGSTGRTDDAWRLSKKYFWGRFEALNKAYRVGRISGSLGGPRGKEVGHPAINRQPQLQGESRRRQSFIETQLANRAARPASGSAPGGL